MQEILKIILTFLDDVLELIRVLFPNLSALVTAGTVTIIFIRMYLKWSKNRDRQDRAVLFSMVKYLYLKEGGTWPVDTSEATNIHSAEKQKMLWLLHWGKSYIARSAGRFTNWIIGRMKAMQKFKSRKFWMAVVTALLVILNDGLDLGIDNNTVLAFAGLVATWILGESAVDAKRVGKESVTHEPTQYPIDPDSRV